MAELTPYRLVHPLDLKNSAGEVVESIRTLQLRRLSGRDMRALDNAKGNGSMLLTLVSKSSGLPPSTVDEMDAEDVTNAGAIVAGFLGGSLPTGATS